METAVSFILVNYQTPQLTLQCIRSIRQHTRGLTYEIIVVDNASADDSLNMLLALPDVNVISNTQNSGFGNGNNKGASYASGKYLFFINTDTYLLNNAAYLFYESMEKHPQIACCGGALFTAGLQEQVSYGNFPSLFEAFSQLGFYKLYPRYYREHLAIALTCTVDDIKQVDYISGADMFVRATIFNSLKGFDPEFFLYFEETELAWRIKRAGYQCMLVPQAKIVHLEGASQLQPDKHHYGKIRMFSKSRYLYFKKTRNTYIAYLANSLYALQAILLWILKREKHYLKVFRIIVRSS